MKKIITVSILLVIMALQVQSQIRRTFARKIEGVVNSYFKVVEFDPVNQAVTLESQALFGPGQRVMLVQMDTRMAVTENAGNYELLTVCEVDGNRVRFDQEFLNIYNADEKLQLVTVPQYEAARVINPLRAMPWTGEIGGVLALEVTGKLILEANIDASGTGMVSALACSPEKMAYFQEDIQPQEYGRVYTGSGGCQTNEDFGVKGGGIIYIKAHEIDGNTHAIRADGQDADETGLGPMAGGDGGTVMLDVDLIESFVDVRARGGIGSAADFEWGCTLPGSGGNGGVIITTLDRIPELVNTDVTAGTTGDADPEVLKCAEGILPSDGEFGEIFTDAQLPVSEVPGSCQLPRELIKLTGEQVQSNVRISWKTASPSMNAGFIVERSDDGDHYYEIASFEAIQDIEFGYDYVVWDSLAEEGDNYYRIRQFDTDGSYAWSQELLVNVSNVRKFGFEIFPNPIHSNDLLKINYYMPASEQIYFRIVDMEGTILREFSQFHEPGNYTTDIHFLGLEPGVYFVVMATPEDVVAKRFLTVE